METVYSDNFSYKSIEYIVECDASISSSGNYAGVGWVVYSYPTKIPHFEGKLRIDESDSHNSEIQALKIAIKEVQKINANSIIIRTDYEGILHIFKIKNSKEYREINSLLSQFKSWSITCVDRENIKRSHNIANSLV